MGQKRPGWELWLGEKCFGRLDRKESLLQGLGRQLQPPQSLHWQNVHRQRVEREVEEIELEFVNGDGCKDKVAIPESNPKSN